MQLKDQIDAINKEVHTIKVANKALHQEQVRRDEILNNDLFAEEQANKYLKKIKNQTDELARVNQLIVDKERLLESNSEKMK